LPAATGRLDFHVLRSRGYEAELYAFDLIEHDGDDMRDLPLNERMRRLKKLLGGSRDCRSSTSRI